MSRKSDLAKVGDLLGHRFARADLLNEALTHPSVDRRSVGNGNYQRLEFLGDRVLGLVMAEYLYLGDPSAREGDLAVRYNALVRREAVAGVAEALGLGPHIRLGPSEEDQGGREKPAILADVMEAVIGAMFLDAGLDVARTFVLRAWGERIEDIEMAGKDAKTRLQELLQSRGKAPPVYDVRDQTGPDHAPLFTVEVSGEGIETARGEGRSRREAEQVAADRALRTLHARKR